MTDTPALLVYTTYRLVPDDVEAFRSMSIRMKATASARDGCAFRRPGHLSADRGMAGSGSPGRAWHQ